jgi:hypothetical protein
MSTTISDKQETDKKIVYFCSVSAPCIDHEKHYLTGRTTNKSSVEALLREMADDLYFYNDKCPLQPITALAGIGTNLKTYFVRNPKRDEYAKA